MGRVRPASGLPDTYFVFGPAALLAPMAGSPFPTLNIDHLAVYGINIDEMQRYIDIENDFADAFLGTVDCGNFVGNISQQRG